MKPLRFCVISCLSIFILSLFAPVSISSQAFMTAEEAFEVHDIEHYAYMDASKADARLKPIILEARKRIIYSVAGDGWAQDGVKAYVADSKGNIKERIPCFHELFPADWEPPI